jgi:hypothetical protein
MPERAKSLTSAFIAGTLALAALLGVNTTASAAAECLENPDPHVTQPGRWHYRSDRTLNRKCWRFDPADATAATQAAAPAIAQTAAPAATQLTAPATVQPAAPSAAAYGDSQQSLLSRFGFSQPFSSPPQQPNQVSVPENSAATPQTISPNPAKSARTVRREQPKTASPPTTNGAAAEPRDQSRQLAAEKNEKPDAPINVAEREALFRDFVKWQMEMTVFGRP